MTAGTNITSSTLESNAWKNIYDIVDNRNNIADPRSSSAAHKNFVFDSDPLHKASSFEGLPYIVLELPVISTNMIVGSKGQSADGKHKFLKWVQRITVRTAKDGVSGNNEDIGRKDMFSITDDLNETFNKLTVRNYLSSVNVQNINLIKDDTDTLTLDQKEVYEATYMLEYETRIKISD